MKNLKIWQRLIILAAAFLVPVIALLYFLVREQSLAIDFARQELAGVEYLRGMKPLFANLMTERDIRAAVKFGDGARAPDLNEAIDAVKQAFAAMDDVAAKLSGRLNDETHRAQREAIFRLWNDSTPALASGAEPDALLLKEALRHIVLLGNNSKLVLDPDVDSYYCMDAVVFKLPKLIAELSNMRRQVHVADREMLRAMAASIEGALSDSRDNIDFGFQSNPEIRQQLRPILDSSDRLTQEITSALKQSTGTAPAASALFAGATAAIDANFQSYDAVIDVLESLLHRRLDGLARRRLISFSVLGLSLLISLSVVFSLQREVEARTEDLAKALKEVQHAQAQLVHSEKMAALGNLVAGVSHEINTPVGISVTAATSLEDETRRLHELAANGKMKRSDFDQYVQAARDLSRLILSNLDRASALIQSFKQVAVDQSSETRRQFEVKTYIEEIVQSLYPKLKKTRHSVQIECADKLSIFSYPGTLSQILTNFITNSLVHAYGPDDEGKIRIRAAGMYDGSIRLTYSDDGKGIPQHNIEKIFDPFFTTARSEGGSGLGLNIVYNLVTQRLKGTIRCESVEGSGTTFTIEMPDLKKEKTAAAAYSTQR